ncbi:putative ABC transporter permease [Oscillibacter valericigenes]|nr:putative ABC transporter permease [Oscillibacter valericigenes]
MATLTPLPIPQSFQSCCALFLLFIAYSTLGWCGEMLYCSIPKGKLCEKRGFLNGFLCPIYGHGALLVLYGLRGGFQNPLLTFFFGALLTSALEYFTSWLMEKLFHMRWWDYSHYKFQINGRVCLLNSTCFGLACVLLCHIVHPWLWGHILGLGDVVIVPLASFICGIYLTDTVLSVRSAIQLSAQMGKLRDLQSEIKSFVAEKREENLERRAERREEARERARALRYSTDIFERRLLHSHPQLRAAREDLLAGIRARLNESESAAKREADSVRTGKKSL